MPTSKLPTLSHKIKFKVTPMNQLLDIKSQEDMERYYRNLPEKVSSITEYIGIMEHRWTMDIPYFRGEPELFEKPCLPGIWRGVDINKIVDNSWSTKEQKQVNEFQSKIKSGELSDPYIEVANLPDRNSIEWLELAQHYGYPTRLLDVTLDPLVALFFAVSSSSNKDGCVYLSNGSSFNTLDSGEFETRLDKFFEIYSLRGYKPADDTLFFYRPLARNRRMIAQRGQFVWCRGIGRSLRATDTRIVIPAKAKSKIKASLSRLGYTDIALLPNS